MAIFNPQIAPTNDPNWTNVSRPISQPEADKSTGMLLAATGEALNSATELADRTEKDYLQKKVTKDVSDLQDAFITGLKDARSAQIIPSDGSAAAVGTLAPQSVDVPSNVQDGVNRAQQLAQARIQNGGTGKANDTLYAGALYAYTKQLRSENPGYRNYIDEQISKVSGKDPANYFMQNILQDINQAAGNQKSEIDKAVAMGRQYLGSDPQMPMYIEAVRQGLPGSVQLLESRINGIASKEYKHKNWKMEREEKTAGQEDDLVTQKDQYRQQLGAAAYRLFTGVVDIPGLTKPATMQKLIQDDANGINPLTDEQKTMLLPALIQAQQAYEKEAKFIADRDGYARTVPIVKDRNDIRDGEGLWFTHAIDALKNDKYGTMFANRRRVTSIQSDTQVQILSDPNMAVYARATDAWTKFGGPNWVNTAQAQFLMKGGATHIKNFLEDAMMKSQTPDDLRKDGVVKSMYDDIKKAQDAAVAPSTRAYDNLVDNVNTITDPKAPIDVKKEVVKYAFKPKNWGIMDRFGKDFTDEDGKFHKGKYAVFDTMTQQGITDNIWSLKDADSWKYYKNWGEQSFKKLYSEEINDLTKIGEEQSMKIGVKWDADGKRFELSIPTPKTSVEANYIKYANETVNRMNSGLYNLSRIQDKEGTDTSAYLLKTMIDIGYRPNENVRGLPQQMINEIVSSKKARRIEDAFKASRGQ